MTRGLDKVGRVFSSSRYLLPISPNICRSCLRSLQRRSASTAAALVSEEPGPVSLDQPRGPAAATSTAPREVYNIKAGIVLSRPPLLTRELTPFEKAYFLYQRRLNERLALPFTRYFYFQKGTPGDVDWKRKIKDRLTPSRDIGVYKAYGTEGWNDELLVGAKESEPEQQLEALLKDAIVVEDEDAPGHEAREKREKDKVERPMSRVTEADKAGDLQSLNRALSRTLYLVVKGDQEGNWEFPSGDLVGKESLHRAAERIMVQAAGMNMNTWIVGHTPVGHYNLKYREPAPATISAGAAEPSSQEAITEGGPDPRPAPTVAREAKIVPVGEKTFFMKARIMAGQANLKNNTFGLSEFRWLAKDELRNAFSLAYWKGVRNMLVER